MNIRKKWLIGVLLACLLGIGVAFSVYLARYHRACSETIETHKQFLRALSQRRHQDAYALMSTCYKNSHTFDDFNDDILGYENEPEISWKCDWNTRRKSRIWQTNGEGWTVGLVYEYVKEDAGWRFTGTGEYFVD